MARCTNSCTVIHKDALMSTSDAKIAPMSENVKQHRHSREPTHGNVLKESDFFPGFYLVYFFEVKKYFYCTENVIKLECAARPASFNTTS